MLSILIPGIAGAMSEKNEKTLNLLGQKLAKNFTNDLVKCGRILAKFPQNSKREKLVNEIMQFGRYERELVLFTHFTQKKEYIKAAQISEKFFDGTQKLKLFTKELAKTEKELKELKKNTQQQRRKSLVLALAVSTGVGVLTLPFWKKSTQPLSKIFTSWYRSK